MMIRTILLILATLSLAAGDVSAAPVKTKRGVPVVTKKGYPVQTRDR